MFSYSERKNNHEVEIELNKIQSLCWLVFK